MGEKRAKKKHKKNKKGRGWFVWLIGAVFLVSILQLVAYIRWSNNQNDGSSTRPQVEPDDEDVVKQNGKGEEGEMELLEQDPEEEEKEAPQGNPPVVPEVERHDSRSLKEALLGGEDKEEVVAEGSGGWPMAQWQNIPDDVFDNWLKEAKEGPADSKPTVQLQDVQSLTTQVQQAIQTLEKRMKKFTVDVVEDGFSLALDDIITDAQRPPRLQEEASKTTAESSGILDEQVAVEVRDKSALCGDWKSDQESFTLTHDWPLMYSVAESVPQTHAYKWKKVLVEMNASPTAPKETKDKFTRLLLLPWTSEATLMSLENLVHKSFPYRVVASRLLDGNVHLWPISASRQHLVHALQVFMRSRTCTLTQLGIVPYSAQVVGDQCQQLFSTFSNEGDADVPWLVKSFTSRTCSPNAPSNCIEAAQKPIVVRGLAALRNRFGACTLNPNLSPVLLERAVLDPLLIHSRRFKLHVLLLVTSTNPWKAYWNKGFVTLASSVARTDTASSFAGSSVSSQQALEQETTNLHQQRGQLQSSDLPLWDSPRFDEFLDTYGYCTTKTDSGKVKGKNKCESLWQRVETIVRFLVEASIHTKDHQSTEQGDDGGKKKDKKAAFQIFKLSFWVDEHLVPIFHRGSSDLSMLLDTFDSSSAVVEDFVHATLHDALKLALDITFTSSQHWKLIKDELTETCGRSSSSSYDPCTQVAPMDVLHIKAGSSARASMNAAERPNDRENEKGRKEEDEGKESDEESEESEEEEAKQGRSIETSSSVVVASQALSVLVSPKSALPKERRGPHVSLDEL